MPVPLKQRVATLTREVRNLKDELRVCNLNYSFLFDLVNDAACALRLGRPLDEFVIEGLKSFEWKDDGRHVKDGR